MAEKVRNLGRPGIAAGAISAVDAALWDLKARLLDVPLAGLLGGARDSVPLYGSGGFTSYSDDELQRRMADLVREGLTRVKMKVGRDPGARLQHRKYYRGAPPRDSREGRLQDRFPGPGAASDNLWRDPAILAQSQDAPVEPSKERLVGFRSDAVVLDVGPELVGSCDKKRA